MTTHRNNRVLAWNISAGRRGHEPRRALRKSSSFSSHFRTIGLVVTILSFLSISVQHAAIGRLHQSAIFFRHPPSPPRPVIAYAVSLTGCGGGHDRRYDRDMAMGLITQGAAVLRHSIVLAHTKSGRYDFKMYAFVHPDATNCSETMVKLGFDVMVRDVPFDRSNIQGEFLRNNIDRASCCGAKEYIKLYSYTLDPGKHPIVVHLDLDSLVLQPLDDLFDAMLLDDKSEARARIPLHGNVTLPKKIDAFYTRDYNMVNPGHFAGVQGGFFMVRPNKTNFDEYIDIVLDGNFIEGRGWGGKYGYFFGGMQIQGICAYYWRDRHPEGAVELNRCNINSMVDSPLFGPNNKKHSDKCRDGRDVCEDCRETETNNILSAHFTLCLKPWVCAGPNSWSEVSKALCSSLHREWFRIRRDFENSRTDHLRQLPDAAVSFQPEISFGFCKSPGKHGYLPILI